MLFMSSGSSPRMRGTPDSPSSARSWLRFIPAYAGNTWTNNKDWGTNPVHPRVCGEHELLAVRPSSDAGSSPRMRGTRRMFVLDVQHARFIPAYAGNTYRKKALASMAAVHPRVCGEHTCQRLWLSQIPGSSPRMRGTPSLSENSPATTRFIPAYAGNTHSCRCCPPRRTVHPRVCGEHVQPPRVKHGEDGSSPRMRGTQLQAELAALRARFIPAYAGNTTTQRRTAREHAVHPRVCGEHGASCDSAEVFSAVHPRVCGEHRQGQDGGGLVSGSSPRMRGTLVRPGVPAG